MSATIGAAARASGVSAKMIRYYEETGLLGPAERTASGYRVYGEADLHALRLVRRARDLGFAMAEIADLLALRRDRERAGASAKGLALAHVADLRRRIRDLEAMARTLETLAERCCGDRRPDCPILDELERIPTKWKPVRRENARQDKAPERIPTKRIPVRRKNARQKKDLEPPA